jgi:TATA-binding protein-associated factor Taf7
VHVEQAHADEREADVEDDDEEEREEDEDDEDDEDDAGANLARVVVHTLVEKLELALRFCIKQQ